MTTALVRFALMSLACTVALVGCKPLDKKSSLRDNVMKEPDAAFLKRVKNDPFPAAGQAPKTTAANPTDTQTSPTSTPIRGGMRTNASGRSNIASGTGGGLPLKPTEGESEAASESATAIATDAEPTVTASSAPLPNRNIRPLNRPATAIRRN